MVKAAFQRGNARRFGPLVWHVADRSYWFRLFGYGLHLRDVRRYGLIFSERYGYIRLLRIGHWAIRWMGRD